MAMENTCQTEQVQLLTTWVYELPGEPSIVINGLPPMSSQDALAPPNVAGDSGPCKDTGFGEWLVGREVRKLFEEQLYSGIVTEFDKEMGWYGVVYEDGDSEELDWHELEQILRPLDITVPLKTVAAKIIKRSQKSLHKSKKTGSRSGNPGKEKQKLAL